MTSIDHEELRTVDGGWCIPFGTTGAIIYLASGGDVCFGISNEAN